MEEEKCAKSYFRVMILFCFICIHLESANSIKPSWSFPSFAASQGWGKADLTTEKLGEKFFRILKRNCAFGWGA
jgi:hypothetical protein